MTEQRRSALRCAIYTRKSSEEGLEQGFNSLEAQHEACEAYIRSQAHEGWKVVNERFDDGGFSGGSMDRPALQRLLGRIRDNRVDVIVIYKIDRLTRSLMDFAKLAELFDKQGVSFVSVTQQFNTTTSMGRLMLNVLLSFAQFEREITGERIRDKIAASKKKGMWMGGAVPLGYDSKDRTLVINETEAKIVRTLYSLYLKLGNVHDVWREAGRLGLRTKTRTYSNGKRGGGPFFPGHIYWLLKSRIYAGKVMHKGVTYPGNHPPIIESKQWEAVQARLAANRVERHSSRNAKHPSPLAGLLFNANGTRFAPTHTQKEGKRYRYYVDPALTTGVTPAKAGLPRVPALEIEHAVRTGFARFLGDGKSLLSALGPDVKGAMAERAIKRARELAADTTAAAPVTWVPLVRSTICRVLFQRDAIVLSVVPAGLRTLLLGEGGVHGRSNGRDAATFEYRIQATVQTTRGSVMKLVIGNELEVSAGPNQALLKAVARAFVWAGQLKDGAANSIRDIARAEGVTESWVARVLRLAYLAPAVIEDIVEGRQPTRLNIDRLVLREDISLSWNKQLTMGKHEDVARG